jgi:hypothetical protein
MTRLELSTDAKYMAYALGYDSDCCLGSKENFFEKLLFFFVVSVFSHSFLKNS